MARRSPPPGLALRGARVWKSIANKWELRPDEQEILLEACRTLDLIDRLRETAADEPAVVLGSRKQPRANPLLAEIAAQQKLAAALFAQLKLADEIDEVSGSTSTKARSSALAHRNGNGSDRPRPGWMYPG